MEMEKDTRARLGTALTIRPSGDALLPTETDWATITRMAQAFLASGLLPDSVKTWQAAATIMQTGRELGIGPMQALRNIAVINGKPTVQAELMLALIYRDHGDDAVVAVTTTAERAEFSYKRRSWPERRTYAYTIDDAKRAGLSELNTWKKHTPAMLRARCISAIARMAFPDTIGGLYTAEELVPDRVTISESGEVVLADAVKDKESAPVRPVRSAEVQGALDERPALDRVADEIATESDDAGAHGAGQGALPGQGRPPKTATVEGIRRNELFTGIQAMAGVKLDTGERWKELARRHEMVEPARNADLTVGWLEELDRRMRRTRPTPAGGATRPHWHATDVTEQALAGWIASAPDDATLEQLASDVLAAQHAGTVTQAAAEALLEAVDARYEGLHEAATEQAIEEAVTVSPEAGPGEGVGPSDEAEREAKAKEAGEEAIAATSG